MEYQHRWFWNEACGLFFSDTTVVQVSLESPQIKAFDDVVARYSRPRIDAFGRSIEADHYQLKFHIDGRDVIQAEDLTIPKFIGADTVSLLQRVRMATANGHIPARLNLVTSWQIDQSDVLHELVSNRHGEVSIKRLFGTEKRFREARELWAKHLELKNHEELIPLLQHLHFWTGEPMYRLDRELNLSLRAAGLAPVDESVRVHPYDGLARRFIDDEEHDFDAARLRGILENEQLWVGLDPQSPHERQIAIKSFRRFAAQVEDVADTLDLLPDFVGREISADVSWSELAARVAAFLEERISSAGPFALHLDCHYSLAFAAGPALQKAGADVSPVQKTSNGRETWRLSEPAEGPQFDVVEHETGAGHDVAIALSITHQIADDVLLYVREHLPQVGRVIVLTVKGGPGSTSVRDANHALALALETVAKANERTEEERRAALHIFAAAPNAVLFFTGKFGGRLGPTTIYEFAFEENRPGGYSPGITL